METQKPLLDPSTARSSVQAAYLSQISSEVAPLLPPTSAIPGRYTLHSIVDSVASFIWGEPWTAVGTIKAWFEGLWKVKVEKNTSQLEQTKLVGAAVIARAKELMGAASSQDLTDDISWPIAKLCYLTSTCMYLRNPITTAKAAVTRAKAAPSPPKTPLQLLDEANESVQAVVDLWGGDMYFQPICDMTPVKDFQNFDGPYAGAFVCQNLKAPFIIIAFRGTATFLEWIRDFNFTTRDRAIGPQAAQNILWNANIHEGFYSGLFNKFEGFAHPPFDTIVAAIEKIALSIRPADSKTPVPVWCAGHSLGGAYATLTFAELLRRSTLSFDPIKVGGSGAGAGPISGGVPTHNELYSPRGLHTIGAPRVGDGRFASETMALLASPESKALGRQVRRLVNGHDPVPFVPIKIGGPESSLDFCHLDLGLRLVHPGGSGPMRKVEMISEVPKDPKTKQRKVDSEEAAAEKQAQEQGLKMLALHAALLKTSRPPGPAPSTDPASQATMARLAQSVKPEDVKKFRLVHRELSPALGTHQSKAFGEAKKQASELGIPNVMDHTRDEYWEAIHPFEEGM